MRDDFSTYTHNLTAPAFAAETVLPDDDADLDHATRALFVGQGGDVVVQLLSGDTVTFANMQSGTLYPMRVRRVFATGTTADLLVGLR